MSESAKVSGNASLDEAWATAGANPGKSVDIGRIVVCDGCSDDYTDSPDNGGLIFGSYAYCPKCTSRMLPDIKRYNEQHNIKARCPEGKSFADFVRDYRGPDGNKITIHAGPRKPEPECCVSCKEPFTSKNVHTDAGWRETQLSRLCEDCFDAAFADMEDDE